MEAAYPGAVEGQRAQPVLDRQPPAPMAAPVRIVELDEENVERALVPVTPYASESIVSPWEESSEPWKTSSMQTSSMPFTYQEGQYNMDHNTLMFIAGQGRQQSSGMPRRPPQPPAPLGPCYNCGGDHLIRECPHPRQPRQQQQGVTSAVPALARYCLECGIKHLVMDCPLNPERRKGKRP